MLAVFIFGGALANQKFPHGSPIGPSYVRHPKSPMTPVPQQRQRSISCQQRQPHSKLDGALDQRFGAQGRDSLHASGRDFGTSHVKTEGVHVKFDLPKKVSWDQKKLKTIAERIVASGEAVESYLDIKLSVPESRYTNWPPALQQQFADARTVEAGKPSFHISPDSEV